MITLGRMLQTVLIDTHDVPSEILVCVHDKPRDKTEICPRSSENQARCPNLFVAMELPKIIQSKVVRLSAAIESWKASFFVCNICTHAGWRESVAIWMCTLAAAFQAEAKEFELLLLFATVQ